MASNRINCKQDTLSFAFATIDQLCKSGSLPKKILLSRVASLFIVVPASLFKTVGETGSAFKKSPLATVHMFAWWMPVWKKKGKVVLLGQLLPKDHRLSQVLIHLKDAIVPITLCVPLTTIGFCKPSTAVEIAKKLYLYRPNQEQTTFLVPNSPKNNLDQKQSPQPLPLPPEGHKLNHSPTSPADFHRQETKIEAFKRKKKAFKLKEIELRQKEEEIKNQYMELKQKKNLLAQKEIELEKSKAYIELILKNSKKQTPPPVPPPPPPPPPQQPNQYQTSLKQPANTSKTTPKKKGASYGNLASEIEEKSKQGFQLKQVEQETKSATEDHIDILKVKAKQKADARDSKTLLNQIEKNREEAKKQLLENSKEQKMLKSIREAAETRCNKSTSKVDQNGNIYTPSNSLKERRKPKETVEYINSSKQHSLSRVSCFVGDGDAVIRKFKEIRSSAPGKNQRQLTLKEKKDEIIFFLNERVLSHLTVYDLLKLDKFFTENDASYLPESFSSPDSWLEVTKDPEVTNHIKMLTAQIKKMKAENEIKEEDENKKLSEISSRVTPI